MMLPLSSAKTSANRAVELGLSEDKITISYAK